MTREELNYIKDAFSQIIDDIAGNPDWLEAARAVASDLGTLERELEEKVASIPLNLDEAAKNYSLEKYGKTLLEPVEDFKAGAEWMAGQGVTCGGRIMKSSTGETYAESDYVPLDGKCGDRVIVQIRKK